MVVAKIRFWDGLKIFIFFVSDVKNFKVLDDLKCEDSSLVI